MALTSEEKRQKAEKERARLAKITRDRSTGAREIGPLPAVVDQERKDRCRTDFRAFIEGYVLPDNFLGWSGSHLTAIEKCEGAVLRGDLFAFAMPRGSGKTTLCEFVTLWALLYGHRRFVFFVGSDAQSSQAGIESLMVNIETNDALLEDFPEVCHPVRALERIHHRCNGQTLNGSHTRMTWTKDELSFPVVEGSPCAGAIVRCAGITGRIRGAKAPDGSRPDLVVVDDPQTDESARSPAQSASRERILSGAILGLAGPAKKIAGIMPCTVICPGDMADNILDRKRYPQWQGERTKMVLSFPDDDQLWSQYAEIRAEGLRRDEGTAAATEFYRKNRSAMDAGAQVYWDARHNEDELSAIQHAMNLKLRDEASFWAEYQNEPLAIHGADQDALKQSEIQEKLSGVAKKRVPIGTTQVTAFIDVQQDCLWWLVAAWGEDFSGWVLDYGAYPDQHAPYFTTREIRDTLRTKHGTNVESAIYDGLDVVVGRLAKPWLGSDDSTHHVSLVMVDANWGDSTNIVYQFCRNSTHANIVLPSHGKYVGAAGLPFQFWQKKTGDIKGLNWHIRQSGKRGGRYCTYDTNFWKTFIHQRLATQIGGRGSLSLYGNKPGEHRMIAQHLTSEVRHRVEVRGRAVDEWKLPTTKPDNHLLDCLAGAAVAASVRGCVLLEAEREQKRKTHEKARKRQRVSYL